MVVHFKQAVAFNGKDYQIGSHEVDEAVTSHPYFEVMKKAGLAFVGDDLGGRVDQPDSLAARQAIMIESLKKAQDAEALKAAGKPPVEELIKSEYAQDSADLVKKNKKA